jgi:hypothetical protein
VNKVFLILFLSNFLALSVFSQVPADSLKNQVADSVIRDSLTLPVKAMPNSQLQVLKENKFLKFTATPIQLISVERNAKGQETLFYILALVTLLLGFLKIFYSKYFNNIFQVFFNTSLRQNQLTDLLLQAKLSSLIFNIYFFITAGIYSYFLLNWYGLVPEEDMLITMLVAVGVMAAIYFVKYCCLLFLGWLADLREPANTYIFITFLVNKIVGIVLLPFIILIAFGKPEVVNIVVIISLMVVGFLFLSRYLRSYGLLQKDLRISILHFIIYILAIEVIPLLVIYKAVFLALGNETKH